MTTTWNISLTSNFAALAEALPALVARQTAFAAMRTANDLAFAIKEEVDTEFQSKFHKPTPFTMSAIKVVKGPKDPRETVNYAGYTMRQPRTSFGAYVGLKQEGMPDRYSKMAKAYPDFNFTYDEAWLRTLSHQFGGGMRRYKSMEGLLLKKGLIKPGYYVVPGAGCPLDQYDNPQRGFVIQMLTYFDAMRDVGVRSNMGEKGRQRFNKSLSKKMGGAFSTEFFLSGGPSGAVPGMDMVKGRGNPNKLPAGIWQRFNSTNSVTGGSFVRPIFLFVKATSYQRRIDFASLATSIFKTRGSNMFSWHLINAIKTDKISKNLSKYV